MGKGQIIQSTPIDSGWPEDITSDVSTLIILDGANKQLHFFDLDLMPSSPSVDVDSEFASPTDDVPGITVAGTPSMLFIYNSSLDRIGKFDFEGQLADFFVVENFKSVSSMTHDP